MAFAFVRGLDANLATLGPGTPLSRTGVTITAGDLVIVSLAWINNVTVSSVTDTAGNTYASLGARLLMSGGTYYQQSWYTIATAGQTSQSVTITFSGSATSVYVPVNEYSFAGPGLTFLQASAAPASAASPMDSGAITPSGRAVMLYGFNNWMSLQPTNPSGWTNRDATWAFTGDNLNVVPGTYRYQPTYAAGNQNWYAEIVAFVEPVIPYNPWPQRAPILAQ